MDYEVLCKLQYWKKNLSQCHFVPQKSHMDRPGVKPRTSAVRIPNDAYHFYVIYVVDVVCVTRKAQSQLKQR